MAMKKKKESDKERVNFRWRPHELEFREILRQKAEQEDQSPSEWARELLKQTLKDSGGQSNSKLTRQMARSIRFLKTIHEDLATMAVMLLAHAGSWDEEDARRWVEEVFNKTK